MFFRSTDHLLNLCGFTMRRLLVNIICQRVADDHLKQRKMVVRSRSNLQQSDDKATVGLSFSERDGRVDHVLVGGPAFASGKFSHGDQILRIDGRDVERDTLLAAMKGNNEAGSEVEITIRSQRTGREESVVLKRVSTQEIADHREMFDLFTKMMNGARRKRDEEMKDRVQKAMDLWSEMMREELENDAECVGRIRAMQRDCAGYLQELNLILSVSNRHTSEQPLMQAQAASDAVILNALRTAREEICVLKKDIESKDDIRWHVAESMTAISSLQLQIKTLHDRVVKVLFVSIDRDVYCP
jgi:hypothetical protein